MHARKLVLVTGAAGFVGRHVCEHLKRQNIAFLGIDRSAPLNTADVEPLDITDSTLVAALFRDHDVGTVIHLAAVLPSAARNDPLVATRVNVLGSMHLIESAVRCGARFVFASSMSVYGSFGSHHVFAEQDPTGPIDLYGTSKRYIEICGELLRDQGHLEFVALRISGVVGTGSGSVTSAWRSEIFEKLGRGSPQTIILPFAPNSVLSLVHVEDVAEMLVRLAQAGSLPSPIYNSPADNWPIKTLRQRLQSLDSNVTVEIPAANVTPAPALSDGSSFERDFAYRLPPIAARLQRAAQR